MECEGFGEVEDQNRWRMECEEDSNECNCRVRRPGKG